METPAIETPVTETPVTDRQFICLILYALCRSNNCTWSDATRILRASRKWIGLPGPVQTLVPDYDTYIRQLTAAGNNRERFVQQLCECAPAGRMLLVRNLYQHTTTTPIQTQHHQC